MLKHLDLFSGIGGFSLGLESAGLVETVAFCDFDAYCQKVLKKNFPSVPVYGDIKELNYDRLKADGIDKIDIITGGYPCQPFSVAGRKKGEEDPRHVWPEYFRLIKELRPTWVIGENVGGHIKLGLDSVLENLESEGYTARTFSISASSIGANHQRERVWIIANSNEFGRNDRIDHREERQVQNDQERNIEKSKSEGERWFNRVGKISTTMENSRCELWPWTFEREENENEIGEEDAHQFERSSSTSSTNVADSNTGHGIGQEEEVRSRGNTSDTSSEDVANTEGGDWNEHEINGEHGEATSQEIFGDGSSLRREGTWWAIEPDVGRVAHGVPQRVDRLKCLGNSVVPQIPYLIGLAIKETIEHE